jgi:RNA polymerase sigma factor (sigma-70 family)
MSEEIMKSLVVKATQGDKKALESLIRTIQDKIYGFCLRLVWRHEEAQEACQEVLVKVITHLSQFKFESRFETWVFRIVANHVADLRRASPAAKGVTFSSFEEELLSDQIDPSQNEADAPDFQAQISEIRISCTTALLQCLDTEHRLAYVLGEILECNQSIGSEVLDISPVAFRKRLERSREQVEIFTRKVCGVISENGKCRCPRRLQYAKSCGRVDFTGLPFVAASGSLTDPVEFIRKIDLVKRTAAHYRLSHQFKSPVDYGSLLEGAGIA